MSCSPPSPRRRAPSLLRWQRAQAERDTAPLSLYLRAVPAMVAKADWEGGAGFWRAAAMPEGVHLAEAEDLGGTPFAYSTVFGRDFVVHPRPLGGTEPSPDMVAKVQVLVTRYPDTPMEVDVTDDPFDPDPVRVEKLDTPDAGWWVYGGIFGSVRFGRHLARVIGDSDDGCRSWTAAWTP